MYYLTVDELTALMPSVFTSTELNGVGWSDLSHEDVKAILGRSEGFIDDLRFKGQYVNEFQCHAFPRKLNTGYVVEKNDERVQKALCHIFYDLLKYNNTSSNRLDLIKQGVRSISVAGVSESYGTIDEVQEVSQNYVKYLGFCLFKGIL